MRKKITKNKNENLNETKSQQSMQSRKKNLKRVFEILARRPFY